MKPLVFLLAVLLSLPTALAKGPKSKTIPIDGKISGSIIRLDEGGLFDVNMKGKPGSANGRGLSITGAPVVYDDLPDDNACANFSIDSNGNPTGAPSGMLILAAQMVMTFKDGSMIWAEAPADGPVGYVCFSGFAFAPYKIMGGHKRFKDAGGWIVVELDTYRFGDPKLITPETGIATGEIVLP